MPCRIHFPVIINFTSLGVMRRLNGRKTQCCRSIAICDKVTELTTVQRKLLHAMILWKCLTQSSLPVGLLRRA